LVAKGKISGKMAKTVFGKMFETGKPAWEIVVAEKMEQVTDAGAIGKLCRQVVEANPKEVESYKKGKTALFSFFVGQVMKASRGQANPQLVNDSLKKLLG
ncbi:MAG: Asp-tRNA(Asn)/Glu-tRNA(Gln) amidotransferase subunit GatB, partial [Candidatus Acidiferrales bacterium]